MKTRTLPHGGHLEPGPETPAGKWFNARYGAGSREDAQPRPVAPTKVKYASALGSTSQTPSGPDAGVALPYGRVWVEGRSLTVSAGTAAVDVTLISTQNGVRATFTTAAGATITGGSARFWVFDPDTQIWALGNVDETLPTGARSVSTSDQMITVGAQ